MSCLMEYGCPIFERLVGFNQSKLQINASFDGIKIEFDQK